MITVTILKYDPTLPESVKKTQWFRNYDFTYLTDFDVSDYRIEEDIVFDERLELDDIFERVASDAEVRFIDNSVMTSEFTRTNLHRYEYGVLIKKDGVPEFFGRLAKDEVFQNRKTKEWTVVAVSWDKFYADRFKECIIPHPTFATMNSLQAFLQQIMPTVNTILTGYDIKVGSQSTAWEASDYRPLVTYRPDQQLYDYLYTPGDIDPPALVSELEKRGTLKPGQRQYVRTDSAGNTIYDLSQLKILSNIIPTTGEVNSNPDGYKYFLQPDLAWKTSELLDEIMREYSAFWFIDASGVFRVVNREESLSSTALDINDLVLEESDDGDEEHLYYPYETNEYDSVIVDFQEPAGSGITQIGFYLIYDNNGSPAYTVMFEREAYKAIEGEFHPLDACHKIAFTQDADLHINGYDYSSQKKLFLNERTVSTIYDNYKSVIIPPEKREFTLATSSVKLTQKVTYGGSNYLIREAERNISKNRARIKVVKI